MSSSPPPARIPTPDPQRSCDLHEPPPTARYRRLPANAPAFDEEPTEPGTPPPADDGASVPPGEGLL